jgi:hypothetical protein
MSQRNEYWESHNNTHIKPHLYAIFIVTTVDELTMVYDDSSMVVQIDVAKETMTRQWYMMTNIE